MLIFDYKREIKKRGFYMKKILYVCAMKKEAIDITNKLGLEQMDQNTYRKDNVTMLITGIGKQRTAISIMEYLGKNEKPDLIINVGYAGSTDLKIGEWANITKVYNYEWDIPGEEKYSMVDVGNQPLEIVEGDIEKVECYSSESFVTSTTLEGHIAFDMELHSIALICDMYKIKLLSLKKISDNLSLEKYYETTSDKEIMELSSCLDYINI